MGGWWRGITIIPDDYAVACVSSIFLLQMRHKLGFVASLCAFSSSILPMICSIACGRTPQNEGVPSTSLCFTPRHKLNSCCQCRFFPRGLSLAHLLQELHAGSAHFFFSILPVYCCVRLTRMLTEKFSAVWHRNPYPKTSADPRNSKHNGNYQRLLEHQWKTPIQRACFSKTTTPFSFLQEILRASVVRTFLKRMIMTLRKGPPSNVARTPTDFICVEK